MIESMGRSAVFKIQIPTHKNQDYFMPPKNNATRFLDAHKIAYTAHAVPKEKLGAAGTAEYLQVYPQKVFKTIVLQRPKGGKAILAVVNALCEVDLKAVAKILGEKKIKLTTQKEAETITKLQTGGISPLALINKGFQVLIDQSCLAFESIHISGGERGINIEISPKDLIKITKARTAGISKTTSHIP